MKRAIFIILGSFFVGLGIMGIFVPILPTTPFLLLAAYFYARSSKRLYAWVLNTPLLGDYIKHYREGVGVPVLKKVIVILFVWLMLAYTAFAIVPVWWGQALLLLVAAAVSYHIIRIRTQRAHPGAQDAQTTKKLSEDSVEL